MARQKKEMEVFTARIQFTDGKETERSEWAYSYTDMTHIVRSVFDCGLRILWISGPQGKRIYG